ncbi:hypothetical protein HYH03_003620 [Edaphochlamys debaryana]|uniref:Protein kinase domain-containing protein n=1 Tax=Edaphochlamys debaryana TaxID=47281 RepID=A0A835Y994_9CHLO|nr:hypothetical protein HYH03_003620 [Edaphochlamys debaryana]|eukprot:KAG2498361.1 hypothetical protein HYH03_003620 [Edaphochlamys debaryana]
MALVDAPYLTLTDADFKELLPNPPYRLTRFFTLGKSPGLSSWPLVIMTAKQQIALTDNITLTFTNVMLYKYRGDNFLRVPGLDLLTPLPNGTYGATWLSYQSGSLTDFCYPLEFTLKNVAAASAPPRPSWLPGTQLLDFNYSQAGCENDTFYPALDQRCWASTQLVHDFAGMAAEPGVAGVPYPANYAFKVQESFTYCRAVLTMDCISQLQPVGCFLWALRDLRPLLPPILRELAPPAPQLESPPPSDGDSGVPVAAVVVPCVVGGTLLIAVVTGLALWLGRRHAGGEASKRAALGAGGGALSTTTSASISMLGGGGSPAAPDGAGGMLCAKGAQHDSTSAARLDSSAATGSSPTSAFLSHSEGPSGNPASVVLCVLEDAAGTAGASHGAGLGMGGSQGVSDPMSFPSGIALRPLARGGLSTGLENVEEESGTPDQGQASAAADSASGTSQPSLASPASPTVSQPLSDSDNVVHLLPKVLGRGAFARVHQGLYRGQRVAVKALLNRGDQGRAETTHGLVASLLQELEVLARCRHPNILQVLGANLGPPRPFIVLEMMDTSLERLMYGSREGNPGAPRLLPLDMVLHIGISVARGLDHLHSAQHPSVIHRDLKPANVLISDPWGPEPRVKISDFGLSRIRESVLLTENPDAGTTAYTAPECFEAIDFDRAITYKADIYSYGVLFWEMLAGARPWDKVDQPVVIATQVTLLDLRPPMPPWEAPGGITGRWPSHLIRLIGECWEKDPLRRPAAAEVAKRLTYVRESIKVRASASIDDPVTAAAAAAADAMPRVWVPGVGVGQPARAGDLKML